MTETWQATGTDGVPNLQQVAADRLAAHRQRRAAAVAQEAESEQRTRQHRETLRTARRDDQRRGASTVRDTVIARYQQRESYREFLAAEAERAIAQAQAEAEVATRNAHAVAEAQMALLEELDQLNRPEPGPREEAFAAAAAETRGELAHALADIVLGARELMAEPSRMSLIDDSHADRGRNLVSLAEPATREISTGGLTVRLFEDMPVAPVRFANLRPHRGAQPVADAFEQEADTLRALEEEIDFRRAPEFPEIAAVETQPIPGNLIEFPRELVAPRRARPRLAEGPLLEEAAEPQLRIFEVDADQLALPMAPLDPVRAPEWQTLQLEALDATPAMLSTASSAQTHLTMPLYTASVERRLMAAAVDLCCVGAAWLVAVACVVEVAGSGLRALSLPLMGVAAAGSFALFAVLFQVLFFSLQDRTPGMAYARIALCTFGDGNPSRPAMRRRIVSTLMAVCPLGLGVAWVLLDNDKLGWHDRMSRMYQRAY